MNTTKNNPRFILMAILVLCFASLHADSRRQMVFSWDPGAIAGGDLQINEQARRQFAGVGSANGEDATVILAGVAGNVIGIFAGAYLGSLGSDHSESLLSRGSLYGGIAGSVCGSALGVYLAGSSGGRRGNFASALLGGLIGELCAFGVSALLEGGHGPDILTVISLAVLPPVGSAIGLNVSRNSRFSRRGNGILNLEAGEFGLGVPDVNIQPVMVPDGGARAEIQFNVRILSVEI